MAAGSFTRRYRGNRPPTKPFFDELREEIGEWHDVLPHTRVFESGHVGVPSSYRHDRPGIAAPASITFIRNLPMRPLPSA